MKRTSAVACGILVLALTGCAQSAPAPAPDASPEAVATVAPTTGLPSIGAFSPGGAPTAGPTTGPTQQPARTYTVMRGTIENVLVLSGQVAVIQKSVTFAQDGIIDRILVEPGQTVAEGDVIAELELDDLTSQLRQAKLEGEQARSDLARAQREGELAVRQAELDLEGARTELERARQPATPVQIAEARANLRNARANLDLVRNSASQAKNLALTELDRAVANLQAVQAQYGETVNRLNKARGTQLESSLRTEVTTLERQMRDAESVIVQAQINYDTERNNEVATVQEAEAQVDLAQAQLDDLLRGPDPFDVAERERAVRRAELAVAQARQAAAADPALIQAVESSRLSVVEIEQSIAERRLYAPFGGEVAEIIAAPGVPIQAGEEIMTIVDRSQLEIVADLDGGLANNTQLGTGQTVEVRFSRYPNQTFTGTITRAPSRQTEDAAASTTYGIRFDSQGLEVSVGDIAESRIVLGRKYDALWLPPEAVRSNRDRSYVTMRENGEDKRVEVIVGIIAADKVEILSGLDEGDEVIVAE